MLTKSAAKETAQGRPSLALGASRNQGLGSMGWGTGTNSELWVGFILYADSRICDDVTSCCLVATSSQLLSLVSALGGCETVEETETTLKGIGG